MTHHKTRAQERIDELDASPAALAADLDAVRKPSATTRPRKADEYLNALQRERAEFMNFKRRSSRGARARAPGSPSESLIAQGPRDRRRLRPRDRGAAGRAGRTTRGSRASPRSTASCACCSRARA